MRGQVPTARVGPIIEQLIAERWPENRRQMHEPAGIQILAEKVGCHPDAIDAIVRQENEGAEFNLVDQTLCSLGRPDLWWGVLSDLYWSFNLKGSPRDYVPRGHLRCERRGCGRVFAPHKKAPKSGPNKPRYCSPECNDAVYRQRVRRRNGVKELGVYGRGNHIRRMVCSKGHDLAGENVIHRKDGKRGCLACKREMQRKWVATKRAKQKVAA